MAQHIIARLESGALGMKEDNEALLVCYPEGDYDLVTENDESLIRALYDMYQCNDNIADGDEFVFEGVVIARATGVHVVRV